MWKEIFNKIFLIFLLATIYGCVLGIAHRTSYRPIVLMHGIWSTNESLTHVETLLRGQFPGIYVRSVEVGDGWWDSWLTNLNWQVDNFAASVKSDPQLQDGFNLIGFSQGGLVSRGYIEKYNDPKVFNFISWVSPQGGQFGTPQMGNATFQEFLDYITQCCMYDDIIQDTISFATYWKDPYALDTYVNYSKFLAYINNDRSTKNSTYKNNILSLDSFVMGYSTIDTVLIPKETGWFASFAPNTVDKIIYYEDTPAWQEDWIGLHSMYNQSKLFKFRTDCIHQDYYSDCFDKYFTKYALPHLN